MISNKKFISALRFNWLTRFYDPLLKLTKSEKKYKKVLRRANINDHDTVLDFGCGTGTLAMMTKQKGPKMIVHGIDVDPNVLNIAQSKVDNHDYAVFLKLYDGTLLPYKDDKFDKVLSTLVFHHLTRSQKLMALEEIYRTLKVGGKLHVKPEYIDARHISGYPIVRWFC